MGEYTKTYGSYGSFAGGYNSIASGTTCFIHSTDSAAIGDRIVVLGGQNITGTTNDTVYVPYLNISNIGTGTPIINLAIDLLGNVVTGTTGGATFTGGTVNGQTNFTNGLSATTISAGTILTKFQTLTDAATINWDYSLGANCEVTLTANRILSVTNVNDGQFGTIIVKQDGTGGHTLSLGSPGTHRVANGGGGSVLLTSTPSAQDVLSFFYRNSVFYWNIGYNYN
jgi:hypothetical protein